MASGLSSPVGISGVVFIAMGIILCLVGVILLVVNQNGAKAWYMWTLAILGIILGIVGAIMLAFALLETPPAVMPDNSFRIVKQVKRTSSRMLENDKHVSFSPDFLVYAEDMYPTDKQL